MIRSLCFLSSGTPRSMRWARPPARASSHPRRMGPGTPTICPRGSEIIAWASAARFASSFRKPLKSCCTRRLQRRESVLWRSQQQPRGAGREPVRAHPILPPDRRHRSCEPAKVFQQVVRGGHGSRADVSVAHCAVGVYCVGRAHADGRSADSMERRARNDRPALVRSRPS